MTNKEIVSTYTNLHSLRESANKRFPARLGYAIIHNLRLLQPYYEDYTSVMSNLFQQYGQPQEDGGYLVPAEQVPTFEREVKSLDDMTFIINLSKVPFSLVDNMELDLNEWDALYPMIEEEQG